MIYGSFSGQSYLIRKQVRKAMIERYYKEIKVGFEKHKVHIYGKKYLYEFLEQKSKKDALVLSEYILKEYKKL